MRTQEAIDGLAQRVGDEISADRVHVPGEDAFAEATTLWNAEVRTRPALVVSPRTTAEVSAAVSAATAQGVEVSVRGGGHDWAGRSLRPGGLVVDLRDMRAARVEGEELVLQGGALARDAVRAAGEAGLLVATGTAGLVGMAGLTLGGGYGPLLGTAGLATDNLVAAEVVLADGTVVHTDEHPDLLWALRGGGGNFGVVTSMRVRLHPDRGLVGGMVVFGADEAASVLARYADLAERAPEGLTALVELTTVPGVGPCVLVVPVWSGDAADVDAVMGEVTALGTPLMTEIAATTQHELLAGFDRSVPSGMHWDLRTRTVPALTPEVRQVLLAAAQSRPGPGAGIGVRPFHGAATRVGPEETAFGCRDPHYVVEISAGRPADEDGAPFRDWAEGLRADLGPLSLPGGYPNFLLAEQEEQVAQAYGTHASRLLEVKGRYDPGGAFTATPLPGTTSGEVPSRGEQVRR